MILPVVNDVYEQAGLQRSEIDFVVSGSADYLAGQSFAFIQGLDGVGAWPPISESHVEMDGAWALYEAWMMLQIGHADTALVYCFGKSSSGNLREVLTTQLDPYYLAPTGIDCVATAAMQARALLERSDYTEHDMAEVASRSRRAAMNNPYAQVSGDVSATTAAGRALLGRPAPQARLPTDHRRRRRRGARRRRSGQGHLRAAGLDPRHRAQDRAALLRDPGPHASPSTAACGQKLGSHDGIETAELSSTFTHQELILRDALELGDDTDINPSGGPLAANPLMATGLIRVGEAFDRIRNDGKRRVLAHATSGHCLQQNLVCVMEGD